MAGIRASMAAIMAAFSANAATLRADGTSLLQFMSAFHIKKSGKGKGRGKMVKQNYHYTTDWKEVLEAEGKKIGGGARECARRLKQMEKQKHAY